MRGHEVVRNRKPMGMAGVDALRDVRVGLREVDPGQHGERAGQTTCCQPAHDRPVDVAHRVMAPGGARLGDRGEQQIGADRHHRRNADAGIHQGKPSINV